MPILREALSKPRLNIQKLYRRAYVNVNKFYRINPQTVDLIWSNEHELWGNLKLFVKQIPENDKDKQRVKDMMIRERLFYKLVLPNIQHYLQNQLEGHKDNLTISQ